MFACVFLRESNLSEPINLFIELIELDDVTANGIFSDLISHLVSLGMTEEFFTVNLISLTFDGASVMFGSRGGVSKLLKDKFSSVIVWHCTNHRLELSVHDTVKDVAGTNRFKSFIDKLYVVYHASPKYARELQSCTTMLDMQILKIGRVLGTWWVASSFRSVMAVWQDYKALLLHFEEAENDKNQDKKNALMKVLRKITSVEFILDLELKCDALQELSELSLDLQERNIDLNKAHNKIVCLVNIF
jgi:hypothetical protein